MKNEYRKLSTLKNWDKNPRSIKDKDFERLKTQIRDLGQYKPLLITDDGIVLGGNMRLRAYKELGIEDIWVSVVDAKTEDEKLRYALSDNDRAGYYDEDLLANLIPEYPDFEWENYAVDLGEPQTLDKLIESFKEIEEDEVPEVAEGEPESKLGEVYQLGRHRLMCGDATKIEDVEKLMNGQKADMVFTDPPYGVSYEEKALRNGYKGEHSKINADAGVEEASIVYGEAFKRISENIKDGAIYYVCSPQGGDMEMMMMMMRSTIPCRHQLIWRKDSPVFSMGRLDYDYQHEPILYGWKGSHKHIGGGKFKTSVWDIPRPKSSKLHPTMKPVELIVEAIKDSTKEGDIIIDLFGGSGSTLIACEQTNRTCYMMELDPKYCDVIRKRYDNFIKNRQITENG